MIRAKENTIGRTDEFNSLAVELSEFIGLIGLEKTANDDLVNRILLLIEQAERDSFEQGMKTGLKYSIEKLTSELEHAMMESGKSTVILVQ